MAKTIVITGGTGYIGSAVTKKLVERGDTVIAAVRSDASAEKVKALGATPLRADLTDAAALTEAAAGADAAIQLAATNDADGAAVDLAAAKALLAGLGGKPYVHTGGVWVFGSTDGIVDEAAPFNPPQLTAWRIDNEQEILASAEQGGHPIVIAPGVVVGQGGGIPRHVLTFDGTIHYIDEGAAHWALVHVDDLADLYLLAVDGAPAGSYYLGVTDTLTGKEVAEALAQAPDTPDEVASVSLDALREKLSIFADALVLDQQVTSAKALRELHWSPKHPDIAAELAAGS